MLPNRRSNDGTFSRFRTALDEMCAPIPAFWVVLRRAFLRAAREEGEGMIDEEFRRREGDVIG